MKIRGTTITTPVPKSVYMLDYHEGHGWSDVGDIEVGYQKYTEARSAFNSGKAVIFRHARLAGCGYEDYYCVKHETYEETLTYDALLFIGASGGVVRYVRFCDDGSVSFGELADTGALELKQEVLESQLASLPFKELTGTTSEPVVLRNLESGVYLLNGKIKMINSGSVSNAVNDFYFVSNNGAKTFAIKMATALHAVHQYILTDTTVTFNQCRLDLILERLAGVESQLSSYDMKIPIRNRVVWTALPDYATLGEVVLVDPSGTVNADTTEAWVFLGRDDNISHPNRIWKKLVFADEART